MTDLNDFFAKKDMKKSKGMVKFTTVNEIEKNLLRTDKKRELQKKFTDEEWNEFEEKLKDYSGLKIQNTMSEYDESVTDELGNITDEKAPALYPWKVIENNEFFTTEPVFSKEVGGIESISDWNVYIPPNLRNKKPTSTISSTLNKNQPKNVSNTLEINDKDVFPILSATHTNKLGKKRKNKTLS